MFTQHFDTYALPGDSIVCEVGGFTITATIHRDCYAGAPDEEFGGFWPSLNPKDDGWIGPKSKATLARHMKRAQAVYDAWRDGEWFYCGIVLSVSRDDFVLNDHAASLWGIECNYPTFRKRDRCNAYLMEVANELLVEVLQAGRDAVSRIVA